MVYREYPKYNRIILFLLPSTRTMLEMKSIRRRSPNLTLPVSDTGISFCPRQ